MTDPAVPDLRSLLAEATKPSASVTVPLKQGHYQRIRDLEAELADLGQGAARKRMGAESPIKAKAKEIEALREEMRASSLTFHFEAPESDGLEAVGREMGGRDDQVEQDLRLTALTCVRVTGPDGQEFPERMTWEDFRDLRKSLGEMIYLATIKAKSDEVFRREWSVPFSSAASLILGTET